jgi:hypothetical protein
MKDPGIKTSLEIEPIRVLYDLQKEILCEIFCFAKVFIQHPEEEVKELGRIPCIELGKGFFIPVPDQ